MTHRGRVWVSTVGIFGVGFFVGLLPTSRGGIDLAWDLFGLGLSAWLVAKGLVVPTEHP